MDYYQLRIIENIRQNIIFYKIIITNYLMLIVHF